MIRQCFGIFQGIGEKREQAIWDAGVCDWQGFLTAGPLPGVSEHLRQSVARQIRHWLMAREQMDVSFLAQRLPPSEHWMLFDELRDAALYLDIETTGLSARYDDLTVVGLYDGTRYVALVNGRDLCVDALADALSGCKMLITYFGSQFDVPFLRCKYPELNWDILHYDLCFAGRRVGLTGGLKAVERTLGLARDESIAEVDGYEAVRLWRAHQRGNRAALAQLVDYNEADTRNLAVIAPIVWDRLRHRRFVKCPG